MTHRSVENAAGVPHGSVTYWFASRDGLIGAIVERLVTECEGQVSAIADSVAAAFAAGSGPDIEAVADGLVAWIDDNREIHLARLELELAAVREPRLAERMRDAASVFWRMCEPLALALGSDDPARDGRAMAAMVDGPGPSLTSPAVPRSARQRARQAVGAQLTGLSPSSPPQRALHGPKLGTRHPMGLDVLYDDGRVALDRAGITLRRYYFPLGTSKRIPYERIRAVGSRRMGWLMEKGRLWGMGRPGHWMPLDLGRPRRDTLIVLDLGERVKPSFSPDDAGRVLEILGRRAAG